MTTDYDCTSDVWKHKGKVTYWIEDFAHRLIGRAKNHDLSKLEEPEKAVFNEYTPKLKELKFGSDEYKAALVGMGSGLKHHYENNRHHPEHFDNGISGMTLLDIVEMLCDWLAAAEEKRNPIDLDYLSQRFGIDDQLLSIFVNTLSDIDFWNEVDGVPVTYFTPPTKLISSKDDRDG